MESIYELDSWIEYFLPDYKQRINDSQILTYIYTKYENKKMLTKEDLSFIYEIDRKIESFGYYEDPRISKIKEKFILIIISLFLFYNL